MTQPLRLIRLAAVESMVGLKRACLYDRMSRGLFPRPVRLGDARNSPVAWPEHEVQAYIAQKIAARDQAAA